jgi:hypothetical protein
MIVPGHRVMVAGRSRPCAGLLLRRPGDQFGDIVLTGQSHRSDQRITEFLADFAAARSIRTPFSARWAGLFA